LPEIFEIGPVRDPHAAIGAEMFCERAVHRQGQESRPWEAALSFNIHPATPGAEHGIDCFATEVLPTKAKGFGDAKATAELDTAYEPVSAVLDSLQDRVWSHVRTSLLVETRGFVIELRPHFLDPRQKACGRRNAHLPRSSHERIVELAERRGIRPQGVTRQPLGELLAEKCRSVFRPYISHVADSTHLRESREVVANGAVCVICAI